MPRLRCLLFILGISLVVGLWGCGSNASAKATEVIELPKTPPAIPPGNGLFRSHEFRSSLQALPNWTRVMSVAEAETDQVGHDHSKTLPL